MRPFFYAGIDFAMAVLYAVVLFLVIPTRHGWAQVLSGLVVAAPLAMGASMLIRAPWSWALGVVSSAVLLVLALVLLVLTVSSAAFLAGVYGSFGLAASALALVACALIIELVALLPAFQLKFLLTRAGRRCFAKDVRPS